MLMKSLGKSWLKSCLKRSYESEPLELSYSVCVYRVLKGD